MGDKDQDYGINIKFGKEKDGKGKYQPVSVIKNKAINGTNNVKAKNDETQWEMVPPDGGWGWLVLLGAVTVNVLIPGMIKSFGVLLVDFVEALEASNAATLLIPAICYFLYSSLGPLSSVLSVMYSYRTVTLIGGTFAAAGLMLSYFAQSVPVLYLSYGVFVGTGAGLAFPPTVYIVTSYFLRLRGLANGLCISGSPLGSIFLPLFLRYLLPRFGYRGTVLIMGAITLNVWAAALLYEPVEKHLRRVPIASESSSHDKVEEEDDGEFPEEEEEATAQANVLITNFEDEKKPSNNIIIKPPMNKTTVPKSASSVALENYKNTPIQGRTRKISMPIGREMSSQMHSTPALHAVPERRISRRHATARSPSSSSFNYISTPYHGSTLSVLQPEYASNLTLNAITSTFRKSPEKTVKEPAEDKPKFFDLSLLKDPIYLIILISNSTNAVSYTNFVIILPVYAINLGFDKDRASHLLSLVSIFDLVGRIGGAALSDMKIMPKHWYFIGGLIISGISLAFLPTSETYVILAIWCSIFGLSSGVYVGVTAVIMADMLGPEKLTSSYGISLFVNGVIQLVGPPICGMIYDQIKSYGPIFSTLGVILMVGASLWAFMPFIHRKRLKEAAQACKV